MDATLAELAELVGGVLIGDASLRIRTAAPLEEAATGDLTLLDNAKRMEEFRKCGAAAAVIPTSNGDPPTGNFIVVADVHVAFSQIVLHLRPPADPPFRGIHPTAWISPNATVDLDATIHASATVECGAHVGPGSVIRAGVRIGRDCLVGRNCILHPNVVLYDRCHIGDRVIIHAGAVIGAHGFGYHQQHGQHVPAPQLGHVHIEDDVEIGAATTIDRGTYTATRIGTGTKIDNLVQIAHNCRIGKCNLICAQVGIAGSTSTGDYVVMGGQAGLRDHVHVGDHAVLSAMAGITADVPAGAVMMGIPATRQRDQKLKLAALAKLVDMRKEFKVVKRQIAELSDRLDAIGPASDPQHARCIEDAA